MAAEGIGGTPAGLAGRPGPALPAPGGPAAVSIAAAALVGAPILCLFLIALQGDASTARHVAANVLPVALRETAMLLAGVAVVVSLAGIGTAWLVTAYRFPGRK